RQSRGGGGAGCVAGRRALQRARHGCDGGDPARRGGNHAVEGARAEGGESGERRGGNDVTPAPLDRRGLWMAVGAFVIWGVMPLYWHLLKVVPSLQIIMHRIVWSTVLVAGWLLWKYGRGWVRETLAIPRAAWMLALSGALIAFNWGLYIWAVNAGHVVETSLGYFINPLLNVVLGVVVLRERLTAVQWLSVAIATCGVLWLTFNYGSFPWIALTLARSLCGYGLRRTRVGVPPVRGVGIAGLYLFLPALAVLLWGEFHGAGGFVAHDGLRAWGWGIAADR